ncbi:MAG TPA: class I SAM-dependent methyltransferase [Anaerolineae bacterium]|nr:class I SAM-dependent methyltransferase [Anaerolineae bacterium]
MESPSRKLLRTALRIFFEKLYSTYAWAYDLVAWISSMGQWRTWQSAALDGIPEGEILEIGHGTGHLLLRLMKLNRKVYGIDPSVQMTRVARKRIRHAGYDPLIILSKAQRMPLPEERFSVILSTFPSEYIFDSDTLSEVYRVMRPEGLFVIVGNIRITGRGLHDRFAAWLYRITGQTGEIMEGWDEPFLDQGFTAQLDRIQQQRAIVIRVIARKDLTRSMFAP